MNHLGLPWSAGRAGDRSAESSRRSFLKLLSLSGLVIAIRLGGVRRLDAATVANTGSTAVPWSPAAYVRVAADGLVTIICHRSEMG